MAWNFTQASCVATDLSGRLYGFVPENRSTDNKAVLLVGSLRGALASQRQAAISSNAYFDLGALTVAQVLHVTPTLGFTVANIEASGDGHHVLFVGYSQQETAVVALLDVYGGYPLPGAPGRPKERRCTLHIAEQHFFSVRPGLRVQQATWHPLSPAHFYVLTSDNRLRVYNLHDLAAAEQTLQLDVRRAGPPPGAEGGLPVVAGLAGAGIGMHVTAFAFPAPSGWGRFSLLVLTADGAVYVLCPVAPFGMQVPRSAVEELRRSCAGGASAGSSAAAWLFNAFGPVVPELSTEQHVEGITVRHHAMESLSPSLQGPLNAGSPPLTGSGPPGGAAVSLALASYQHFLEGDELPVPVSGPLAGPSGPPSAPTYVYSALLTAWSSGCVYAHVMDNSQLLPDWVDLAPQVVLDTRGEIYAVRAECIPTGPPPPGAAPLLLLDLIHLRPESSRGASGDPDLDLDLADGSGVQGPPLLRRVRLLPAGDTGARFWCVHDNGVWGITARWLPAVALILEQAAAAGGSAAEGGQSSFGLDPGLDPELDLGPDPDLDLGPLPAPAVSELMQSLAPLLDCAAVCDVLAGVGCVVLDARGRLTFVHPHARTGAADASDGASSPAGAAGDEGDSRRAEREYEELLAGPRQLPLPVASGPLLSTTPEGLAYLAQGVDVLNESHVMYAHSAAHTLRQLSTRLQDAVALQFRQVHELEAEAAAAHYRQHKINQRLAAAMDAQQALERRVDMLTLGTWALPRPLSDAEKRVRATLPGWEERVRRLQDDWRQLSRRKEASVKQLRAAQGQGTPPPVLPPGQARKVVSSLQAQSKVLQAAQQRLELLESELSEHLARNTAITS